MAVVDQGVLLNFKWQSFFFLLLFLYLYPLLVENLSTIFIPAFILKCCPESKKLSFSVDTKI